MYYVYRSPCLESLTSHGLSPMEIKALGTRVLVLVRIFSGPGLSGLEV